MGEFRLRLRANAGADAFIFSEVFEHEYYRLPMTDAPKTILDLGANIGLTLIYFERHFPQAVLAGVEPIRSNFDILQENLTLNGLNAAVFAGAIDIADGQIRMELSTKTTGIVFPKRITAPATKASWSQRSASPRL